MIFSHLQEHTAQDDVNNHIITITIGNVKLVVYSIIFITVLKLNNLHHILLKCKKSRIISIAKE